MPKTPLYLYAEWPNGKKLGHLRLERMSTETTRAFLTEKLPTGARILSPLEKMTPGAPITVITVYGSASPDGKRRCMSIEQWGVQFLA